MNRRLAVVLAIGAALLASCSRSNDGEVEQDVRLQRVIADYGIRSLPTRKPDADAKYLLGRALFYDPVLSGNRDVSCATCHLFSFGSSDGLPTSIGVGGVGTGAHRVDRKSGDRHPRNAQDLWNRDNNSVSALFWDGRVESIDPDKGTYRTPLREFLPQRLENTLAVQALIPLVTPDEMLGYAGDVSEADLPRPHANIPNDLAVIPGDKDSPRRMLAVLSRIIVRVVGSEEEPLAWQEEYRKLFRRAYPEVPLAQISIADLANAIAHYEEIAFATRETPWDMYVSGREDALTGEQKRGAMLFFGKGKCYVCHSGPLFSDFEYYALGIPSVDENGQKRAPDLGRFVATRDPRDRFRFRTPPLRNVLRTAPYFHDGSQHSIEGAIEQHMDPLRYADQYDQGGAQMMSKEEIDAIEELPQIRIKLSPSEVKLVVVFLGALNDNLDIDNQLLVPGDVPSGLPVLDVFGL